MRPNKQLYDLVVIGGGPSGMLMAGRAAELGANVILLEKNKILGKKLNITGGGRCNITNAEFDIHKFLSHFPVAKGFLYSPFSKFSSEDTLKFFAKIGLPTVIESRKRAFPKSQKASDVTLALAKYMHKRGVEVKLGAQVFSLKKQETGNFILKTKSGDQYNASHVAIAAGGVAAPNTGSTGSGFKILKTLGHTIKTPNPNIVPLKVKERWVKHLSGVTLSFMRIKFIQDEKIKIRKLGKLLFTHFGLSGPLILNVSHEVSELLAKGRVFASIDCFPDTNHGDLSRRIWRLFEKNKNKTIKNTLPDMIPSSLAMQIFGLPGLKIADKKVHSVSKEERKILTDTLKDLKFEITGTMGFDKAVVADGGVMLEEVNFKNMTSTIHPNLYLIGDTLNINRPSGGYSLQLCWTTGWVAGSDFKKKK